MKEFISKLLEKDSAKVFVMVFFAILFAIILIFGINSPYVKDFIQMLSDLLNK